jgi:hypothetical protein
MVTLNFIYAVNEDNAQFGLSEIVNAAPKHNSLYPMISAEKKKKDNNYKTKKTDKNSTEFES